MKFINVKTNQIVEMTVEEIVKVINQSIRHDAEPYDEYEWVTGLAHTEWRIYANN